MSVCADLVLKNNPLVIQSIESNLIDLLGIDLVIVASNNPHRSSLWFLTEETSLVVIECDFLFDD